MDFPGHALPTYSEVIRDDTLFHYTNANGLLGIFDSSEIWSTAYYCANDEQELSAGSGVLSNIFRTRAHQLRQENDPRADLFLRRGVDIMDYADGFERQLMALTMSSFIAYITCFYKPSAKEDFHHGLLSQWRGYGADGGYALQFSRTRLLEAIKNANKVCDLNYDLEDVYYTPENPLKDLVLEQRGAFLDEFEHHLNEHAKPLSSNRTSMRNPIFDLMKGPLIPLLDYLICTKNGHFAEERECRLSLIQPAAVGPSFRPVKRYSRNGLIVSYTTTPKESFDVLGAVDWILIGPGPRMAARFKAICELVKHSGRKIGVRPSHIPFTRA
jgi:Protein of unknown function (DUF2971)